QRSLDELYNYVKANNADVIDNLVMLRSRMQNLQRSVSNGTMDDQTAALERAKINEAILKLLPQLTPEYLAQASQRREPVRPAAPYEAPAAPARDMKKMYLIGGGVLLVVVILIAIFNSGGDSEGSDVSAEQTTAVEDVSAAAESWAPPEGTLLSNVMAGHSGYAVWKSVYSESNGQSIYRMDDATNWQEIKNGQVVGTFTMVANSDTYVTLHDPARKMFVRIGETNAEYNTEDDPSWYVLFDSGEWITPPDAQ
ncbi:MAG TPA: hypothetical protein PK228_18975, partial [Saprospiraceae bacterium]|nr:hypothetical protein [Saprospiraceae bacterium]